MQEETVSKNFIEQEIDKDLAEGVYSEVCTRFPPEPNGYLHIGHAKSILLNSGLAKKYGGTFHLRFDDTNPDQGEDGVRGVHQGGREVAGSGLGGPPVLSRPTILTQMYECAVMLIKKGKAFVCDLTAEEIREYRGDLTTPGKESPYRNRSVEENLRLFEEMKEGKYKDGEKVLRAKIDMASPNINMRDPVIYRVAHMTHHNTGDKWCIYPMYDFAHPIEDAIEHITHSICTLEFEDHRPLYDWVVRECEFENPPRQIEFAKLYLTNVVTGKRYIKKLVEDGIVDGWDDPAACVHRGSCEEEAITPESIQMFVDLVRRVQGQQLCGLRHAGILHPGGLKAEEAPDDGGVRSRSSWSSTTIRRDRRRSWRSPTTWRTRSWEAGRCPSGRELYIEREDFMEEPPKKYFRLFPGNEVRLMDAYFVKCTGCEKDEDGNVTVVHVHL